MTTDSFDRKLFVIRRWAKELITRENAELAEQFYFASLSTKTIIYKGMLTTTQLSSFYPDLHDAQFKSALAIVHSRFSTNNFSELVKGAAASIHRAQRRNQHSARQHKLDECA